MLRPLLTCKNELKDAKFVVHQQQIKKFHISNYNKTNPIVEEQLKNNHIRKAWTVNLQTQN